MSEKMFEVEYKGYVFVLRRGQYALVGWRDDNTCACIDHMGNRMLIKADRLDEIDVFVSFDGKEFPLCVLA